VAPKGGAWLQEAAAAALPPVPLLLPPPHATSAAVLAKMIINVFILLSHCRHRWNAIQTI